MNTEFSNINNMFRFRIASWRSDLVSKSSRRTITSIKKGINTTLTNSVIYVDTYCFSVADKFKFDNMSSALLIIFYGVTK